MRAVLLFVCYCCVMGVPLRAGVFDTLTRVPTGEQQQVAANLFQYEVLKMDSTVALGALEELLGYAQRTEHRELEVLALGFTGHYHYHFLPGRKQAGIEIFKDALALAQRYGLALVEAQFTNRLGMYLFWIDEHREGFENLLRSDYQMKEIGYDRIDNVQQYLSNIAWAYYYFQSFQRALNYLELALEYSRPESKDEYSNHLKLGITYAKLKRPQDALRSYQRAYEMAVKYGDSSAIGKAAESLGRVYMRQGDTILAGPLINQAIHLCIHFPDFNETVSPLNALRTKAEYLLETGQREGAKEYIKRVWKYMQDSDEVFHEYWEDYYRLEASYHKQAGNYVQAVLYQDSLLAIKDTLVAYNDANLLTGVETLLATESHINKLAVMEKERSRQRTIRNASWFIGGLTLLLLMGIIYSLRMRNIRRKRMFQLEREKAEKQIESYQHQLHNFLEKIRQKNQLIEVLKLEPVHQANGHANGHGPGYPNGIPVPPNTELIARLHESVILTDADWVEFRRLFEQAYPGFLQSLKVKYADLTQAERRFLALVKLDLTVQEMANMLGISPDSVSKTRQRIRRKLRLESYKEIPGVVAAL